MLRTSALFFASLSLMGAALFLGAAIQQPTAQPATLVRLNDQNWERFCPDGKEVDAIYGDFVLQNSRLTAVIAQPIATRNANMTTRDVGGSLIDLTVNSQQNDQLAAFIPGRRAFPYRSAEFSAIPVAGSAATTVSELPAEGLKGNAVAVTVVSMGGDSRPAVRTTYRLGSQDDAITVESVFHNSGDQPLEVLLEDDFRADGQKEDMVRSPNGIAESFWLQDRYWGQAYGLWTDGRRLQLNSDPKTSQVRYVDAQESAKITLAPGESFALTRKLTAGANALDVHALEAERRGSKTMPVSLVLRDARSAPAVGVRVELLRESATYGFATSDAMGRIMTTLPGGTYTARATLFGVPVCEDLPMTIAEGQKSSLDLTLRQLNFGRVVTAITDLEGKPLPCKLEFRPHNADIKLNFGPETAEYAVRNLTYAPLGRCQQSLPPGTYDVLISHGPEFDIVETTLTIAPFTDTPLAAQLRRTVNTTGWVSSDFHSHATPSGDNTSSQLGRVINLVCEHLEFAPCTEHNRISTYQPHIERLGIGDYISSIEGLELTGSPLPLNHQNVFPLRHTPRTQDGGAPTTADTLEEQIERIALWDDRSEKLLQVNHPDLGWMFYDRNGDGQPDAGHERAFPFMDVVEIHPIDSALDLAPFRTFPGRRRFHNTVFRWLQLLNQGYRIYGVVNTDAHYNFHGSGPLRNWIQSKTDNPSDIKFLDMVHAAEQGRLVMSNGPYLEVWATETGRATRVTAGQDLTAGSKSVSLQVRVECPNWLDVNRVFVLVNGRPHPVHDYRRGDHPDKFESGAVKFSKTLELTLNWDAHLIVVAGNVGGSLGKVYGEAESTSQPAAMTNPIFVDVDGGGFTPNQDKLDADLPVKFGAGG